MSIKLTPPDLAKRWRCRAEKVIDLINAGELRAVNISRGSQRPRYLIDEADIETFERSRETRPTDQPQPSKPRKRKSDSVVEYV